MRFIIKNIDDHAVTYGHSHAIASALIIQVPTATHTYKLTEHMHIDIIKSHMLWDNDKKKVAFSQERDDNKETTIRRNKFKLSLTTNTILLVNVPCPHINSFSNKSE